MQSTNFIFLKILHLKELKLIQASNLSDELFKKLHSAPLVVPMVFSRWRRKRTASQKGEGEIAWLCKSVWLRCFQQMSWKQRPCL